MEMPVGRKKKKKKKRVVVIENFWVEISDFFGDFLGEYLGIGAAEGRNVGKGGKIRSGGLHLGLGLSSIQFPQWRARRFSLLTFFTFSPPPGIGTQYRIFRADCFFSVVRPSRGDAQKKRGKLSTRKTPKVPIKINAQGIGHGWGPA